MSIGTYSFCDSGKDAKEEEEEMFVGLSIVIVGLGVLMILERLSPDRELVVVRGWWKRVLAINLFQLFVVIVGVYTWEEWLPDSHLFHLRTHLSPMWGGLVAYLIHTWLFYWFHRARHNVYFLWLWFHQFHHSAQRIETITSFYKSPQEILVDSLLMTILLYPILGLGKESSLWLTICAAFGEYFYHMNIATPQWIGYFFQRPESHRIHHLRRKRDHSLNYADLPLWDILGGTFDNPKEMTRPTGFDPQAESRVMEMIAGRDVLLSSSAAEKTKKKKTREELRERYSLSSILAVLWIVLGLGQSVGYVFNLPSIRGLSFSSVASPLPLVFSVTPNGNETFSTTFRLQLFEGEEGDRLIREEMLTPSLYSELNVLPYNLRNAYGVLFSHGPFFEDEKLLFLRDHILRRSLCPPGSLSRFFSLPSNLTRLALHVHSKTQRKNDFLLSIRCLK